MLSYVCRPSTYIRFLRVSRHCSIFDFLAERWDYPTLPALTDSWARRILSVLDAELSEAIIAYLRVPRPVSEHLFIDAIDS